MKNANARATSIGGTKRRVTFGPLLYQGRDTRSPSSTLSPTPFYSKTFDVDSTAD